MSETKTHIYTPRLPGFESLDATFDADLEARYPGLKDIFDNFLLLNKAPGDIHDEIYYDRNEFPFQAGIAVPDSATGRLELVSKSGNHTRSEEGSLGHAELLATRHALAKLGLKHLPENAVVLSTVEPCSMCAAGIHRAGGHEVIFGLTQDQLRGMTSWVDGKPKPHQAEPQGYSAKEFFQTRNSQAVIIGGYRQSDVLEYM